VFTVFESKFTRINNIGACFTPFITAFLYGHCRLNRIKLWIYIYIYIQRERERQYFSYIVAISFIGGGNRSTQRKPQTWRKSLTNFITFFERFLCVALSLKAYHGIMVDRINPSGAIFVLFLELFIYS